MISRTRHGCISRHIRQEPYDGNFSWRFLPAHAAPSRRHYYWLAAFDFDYISRRRLPDSSHARAAATSLCRRAQRAFRSQRRGRRLCHFLDSRKTRDMQPEYFLSLRMMPALFESRGCHDRPARRRHHGAPQAVPRSRAAAPATICHVAIK